MSISVTVKKEELKNAAGEALSRILEGWIDKPVLLLLSGGSSLDILDFVKDNALGDNMTFGMLDDRYSLDPKINSFSILQKTPFYLKAIRKGATFLDSSVFSSETLEKYAERYESEIKKWIKKNPKGSIVATIGVGPDGHTSGILPFPEDPKKLDELFDGEKLVVGYDVGNKNPYRYRMTSTLALMRKTDHVITFMSGENKRSALQKIMSIEGSLAETPGRILRQLKKVDLYTDISL